MDTPEGNARNSPSFFTAARTALWSMKEAILPGYILLSMAAVLVIAYYNEPSFNLFMEKVGGLKREWGYAFSMINSAFFAGFMPWLFRIMRRDSRPRRKWAYLCFSLVLWGCQGATIDTLYRVQGMLFGTEVIFSVVVCKVLVDQFVYTAFFASPLNANAYYWADSDFSFSAWKAALGKGWYKRIILPNYIANLVIWIPGVSIVYCLPPDLQIFMAGLISCFYALISTYIAGKSRQ